MIKIILKETNEIIEVTRNVAHGLIDRGKAILFKGFEKAKADKMITKERKIRKKRIVKIK